MNLLRSKFGILLILSVFLLLISGCGGAKEAVTREVIAPPKQHRRRRSRPNLRYPLTRLRLPVCRRKRR